MIIKSLKNQADSLTKNTIYSYFAHFSDYLLNLIFLPFIAKTLGVIEFGIVGIMQSYGLVLTLIFEFGSPLVATRTVARKSKNKKKINFFLSKTILLKIIILPFICIISFILYHSIPLFKQNYNYLIIVVLGSFFQGISPTWYFHGLQQMKKIAIPKFLVRLISFLLIFNFVKTPNHGWIVLLLFSAANVFLCVYFLIIMTKNTGFIRLVGLSDLKEIFNYSKNSFLITIVPVLYQNISLIILSVFTNPLQLGLFYGANKIYRAFNSLFSPISNSFFPRISSISQKNNKKFKSTLSKYLFGIFALSLVFLVFILVFSKYLILLLLGQSYLPANETLILFSLVLPLTAISNALGRQGLMYLNKDYNYLISQVSSSIIAFLIFLFFVKKFNINAFPISLIFFEIISIISICFYFKNAIRNNR